MKVIGIVGSRRRDSQSDYDLLVKVFDSIYQPGDWIVSGGCHKGADRMAEMIAKDRTIPMIVYKADWANYGKAAGPIRNEDIANECDVLIAMVAPDRKGGTESTIIATVKLGKYIYILDNSGIYTISKGY